MPVMKPQRGGLAVILTMAWLLTCQPGRVAPYSTGAPPTVCGSATPGHHQTVQTSSPPYLVSSNTTETFGGGRVIVRIEANTDPFKGFILQARDSRDNPVGTFHTGLHQTMTCGEGVNNAVTHNSAEKKNGVTLEWEAPVDFGGDVTFTASIVKEFVTYWTNIKSPKVTIEKRSATLPAPKTPTDDKSSEDGGTEASASSSSGGGGGLQSTLRGIYDGCGISKSCFGYKNKCVDKKNCKFMVTYTHVGDSKYEFELVGKKNQDRNYIAVGLSEDSSMGSDSVVICSNENSVIRIYHSWNDGKSNIAVNNENVGLTLVQSGEVDGHTYCRFLRDAKTRVRHQNVDLAAERYHIMIAQGTIDINGKIQFHSNKMVNTAPVSLGKTSKLKTRDTRLFRAIHGSLMIGAWICAASCGILFARYYKQTWKRFKCCGIDQWFIFHRLFMVSTWALTIAAFVIIVYELREFRPTTHAIIGVVSVGLCFIQPFMAAMRPAPDGKNRTLFNWAHWLVGNVAQILGITAIFFGLDLFMKGKENWLKEFSWYVIVAFIAFHCLTHFVLSIAQCVGERKRNEVGDSFPLKEFASSRTPLQPDDKLRDAPLGCLRKFILTFYLIVNWCVTALLIVIVVFRREEIEEQLKSMHVPEFWKHDK